jgi:hypothetical protein
LAAFCLLWAAAQLVQVLRSILLFQAALSTTMSCHLGAGISLRRRWILRRRTAAAGAEVPGEAVAQELPRRQTCHIFFDKCEPRLKANLSSLCCSF